MKSWLVPITLVISAFVILSITTSPYNNNSGLNFVIIFLVIALMLGVCILPWLKGSFSQKWQSSSRYGVIFTMLAYILGYLTFALSSLI